jgi:hypothetical protein
LRNVGLFLLLLTAVGCDAVPRDVDGTLNAIRERRVLRVGVIAGTEQAPGFSLAEHYLRGIARATGASIRQTAGSMEALLAQVEQGSLDMAIGEVAKDSPWLDDVAVIEPIAERRVGDRQLGLSAIARNGENRWVMLLEQHARDIRRER